MEAWLNRFDVWRQGRFYPNAGGLAGAGGLPRRTITIRLPEGPLEGRFAGIDATGRLELETSEDGVSSMQEIYSLGMDKPRRADFRVEQLVDEPSTAKREMLPLR